MKQHRSPSAPATSTASTAGAAAGHAMQELLGNSEFLSRLFAGDTTAGATLVKAANDTGSGNDDLASKDSVDPDLASKADPDAGSKDASPPVADAGTWGMLTDEVTTMHTPEPAEDAAEDAPAPEAEEVTLDEGTAVEVVRREGDVLHIKAYSGHGGIEAAISVDQFLAQPRLGNQKSGDLDTHHYELYEGALFVTEGEGDDATTEPRLTDIDQGGLSDCYVHAAMGAVVTANPQIIEDMIDYDASTGLYTVTFQELQDDGTFEAVDIEVDGYLPSSRDQQTAYAMNNRRHDAGNRALWPSIIEKAYAAWRGGYSALDSGGSASDVMTAITGVESVESNPPAEDDVVSTLQTLLDEGKAVVISTKDDIRQTNQAGFGGSDEGPYTASLKDNDGQTAGEIVKSSVRITDTNSNVASARDDGDGAITGSDVDEGEIDYDAASVSVTYDEDKGPAAAADLRSSFKYKGKISSRLNLYGWHGYVLQEITADDKIQLYNPWGPRASSQPLPMTAADFRTYIKKIRVNAVPQEEE